MDKQNNQTTKFVLANLRRRGLAERDLENAGKRVWNSLANELNLDTSKMETIITKRKSRSWFRPGFALFSIFSVVVFSLGAAGFLAYQNIYKPTEQEDLSKFKQLAQMRLDEINVGLTSADIKAIEKAKPELLNNSVTHNVSAQAPSQPATINEDELRGILKGKELNKDQAYLGVEHTKVLKPDAFGKYLFQMSPEGTTDFTQTVIAGLEYMQNKTFTSDGKITQLYTTTPQYSLEYMGGKYAIKSVFPESVDGNQVVVSGDWSMNPEVWLLQRIIEEDNIKSLGRETIDGEKYYVFEEEIPAYGFDPKDKSNKAGSLRHYIDIYSFRLERRDVLYDGEVVMTTRITRSEIIPTSEAKAMIEKDELKDVEVKQVNLADSANSFALGKFTDLREKYDVLHVAENWDKLTGAFDITDVNENDPINKLRATTDFNPYYEQQKEMMEMGPKAIYMQSRLQYSIFESEEATKIYDKILKTEAIQVKVSGQPINAKLYATEVKMMVAGMDVEQGEQIINSQVLVFAYAGKWYSVSQMDDYDMPEGASIYADQQRYDLKNLDLEILNAEKAVEVDKKEEEMMQKAISGKYETGSEVDKK